MTTVARTAAERRISSGTSVERLSAAGLEACAGELGELLAATVAGGASLGFLAGFGSAEAARWWRGLAADVADGRLLVWVARSEDGQVLGTVGCAPGFKDNGRHRGEVVKLMVGPQARGRGVARTLLRTVEEYAAGAGMSLLVLDTETGSPAERLYRATGWTEMGTVPDYAADPQGRLMPSTFFYKTLS
ncbi:GNAT family N-acetyltransferase [Streptomyces sp. TRM66268-LWL]|uniref:GNAT family N-acetyltransferase n=1 Tax=Streptomyces polyasparticus TaxID=2767826 RepID=A0ABR7SFZ9_9ACTN|nr:GNAT family N-acetyltransferase [Streptomyces polyasparticus]MBC9713799.1 GNAT family N-acetyltransferase [Streptomyces polyasparticus]